MSRKFKASEPVCQALLCLALVLGSAGIAAADSGQGRVLTVSGQVSLEQGRDLWALQVNNSVEPGQIILCGPNSYALLQLEDGSKFEVFADSRIIFRANRGNWRDLLDILLGKVKVHIQKLGGRPNPYRVNSATALIAVRGTIFEVGVASDESTTIFVEEGIVGVSHKRLPGGREVLLKTGETLTVYPNEALAASTVSKARIAVRVLSLALDSALRMGRMGGGGGRAPVPGVPGGGGDMGQAPDRPPDIPDGDSGPGVGSAPPAGSSPSPGGNAPAPQSPSPKPKSGPGT